MKDFLMVRALVLQRHVTIHLFGIHGYVALNSLVELGFHQLAQHISSGSNHEVECQWDWLNGYAV